MKITICGSIAFIDQMIQIKTQLKDLGHEVNIPEARFTDESGVSIDTKQFRKLKKSSRAKDQWIWDQVHQAITAHFDKINWADAILVTNYDKNNTPNYIGGNTLMEVGLAIYLEKKIYFLNPIPNMTYTEELRAAKPLILNNDISLI